MAWYGTAAPPAVRRATDLSSAQVGDLGCGVVAPSLTGQGDGTLEARGVLMGMHTHVPMKVGSC